LPSGRPVVLAFLEPEIYAVILLFSEHERITRLHVIADPNKISLLSSQL
jgi:hypothetical protein